MEDCECLDGLFDGVEASLKPEFEVLIGKNMCGSPAVKCDLDGGGGFSKFR